jgi:protein-serine/threonine kinase
MDHDNGYRNANGNNRLFLNLPGANDRLQQNERAAYPTTPSTFPQPVFSQGQTQQGLSPAYNTAPHAPAGYFINNPYPPQYASQQSAPQYHTAQQYGNTSPYSPRNDPTAGLAQQLSHQNLRDTGRASPQPARGPLAQRPRTAGSAGQQGSYNNYMNHPMPPLPTAQHVPEFQTPPERSPEKYGALTHANQKRCAQLASDFFKDSVKRARERNVR